MKSQREPETPGLSEADYELIMGAKPKATGAVIDDEWKLYDDFKKHLMLSERPNYLEVAQKAFADLRSLVNQKNFQAQLTPIDIRRLKELIKQAIAPIAATIEKSVHYVYRHQFIIEATDLINSSAIQR